MKVWIYKGEVLNSTLRAAIPSPPAASAARAATIAVATAVVTAVAPATAATTTAVPTITMAATADPMTARKEAIANADAQESEVPQSAQRPHDRRCLRGNKVSYGEFGIQAMEPGWITGNQIEAARVAMTRYTKRGGKVWIKIFPDKPVTSKALGTRMGSGKGAPEYWVAVVKAQKVMFEIGGVSEDVAREALRLAQHKLPIKTKIVAKEDLDNVNGGE